MGNALDVLLEYLDQTELVSNISVHKNTKYVAQTVF